MTSFLGFLPALLALRSAGMHGVSHAFFAVYIPVLLLLPDYYRVITPGLPDPTFNQAVAAVLVGLGLLRGAFRSYRFSLNDLIVVLFAFAVANSEYQASGYSDAQNLVFGMLFSVLAPYFMAKSWIEPLGRRIEFAKRIVICLAIVSIINLYETRFGANPFQQILGRFFPGQGEGWNVTFRFGMARTAGPFGHALLAGIMMLVGFRLQRWLHFSGAWPDRTPRLPWLPIKLPLFLSLILTGGFFITFAKGSWLAGFMAGFLVAMSRIKNRMLAMGLLVGFVLFVLIPGGMAFLDYASVGRANAKDDNQETAAYRYELITEYLDIAKEKATWGWGLTKWPKVPGMPSIDNHYLLLFLMHGQIALFCLIYILLGTMIRLLIYSLRAPPPSKSGGSLPFTLASIYLGYFIALATVYMGGQTVPLLFMITGWAESYMLEKGRDDEGDTSLVEKGNPMPFNFVRIL